MQRRWSSLYFGQVRIRVTGPYVESFINHCLQNQVALTDIQRVDKGTMDCTIPGSDIGKLHSLLKDSHCKFHVLSRKGLPFFLRIWSKKLGFVVGLVLFVAVLFVLSNMVWHIKIEGAHPKTNHQIRQVLDDIGVKNGKFQSSLPSAEDIQYAINNRVGKVAWVGASLDGTTYHFRVVEKEVPEEKKRLSPRNLVATKEGIIRDIYVEQGKARVKPNDYVKKGDVLVSGKIGNKKHHEIVPAKGKVTAETWYETSVTVPLSTKVHAHTGKRYTKHSLTMFGLHIPYWGFSKPDFDHYDVKKKKSALHFLGWKLPFSLDKKTYLQTKESERSYTKEQALEVAKQMGKKDVKENIGKKAQIKSGKILRREQENGKVKVLLYYTVTERIAVPKMIGPKQGD